MPDELRDVFVLTRNGWLANLNSCVEVVDSTPKVFSDFDRLRITDKRYVKSYLSKMTTSLNGVKPSDIAKTGLLLGFDQDSVIAFSRSSKLRKTMKPFDFRGFQFACLPDREKSFKEGLKKAYKVSGVDFIFQMLERRITNEFTKSLSKGKGSVAVLENTYGKFYESTTFQNEDDPAIIKQLLLLRPSPKNDPATTTLNFLAKRYNYPAVGLKLPDKINRGGRMGADFEDYYVIFSGILANNNIPYLEYREYATKRTLQIFEVGNKDFTDWAKQNAKEIGEDLSRYF